MEGHCYVKGWCGIFVLDNGFGDPRRVFSKRGTVFDIPGAAGQSGTG